MGTYTNTTRVPLNFPRKGKGVIDIRPGETVTDNFNEDHPQFKGAIIAGALQKGKHPTTAAPEIEAPPRAEAPRAPARPVKGE